MLKYKLISCFLLLSAALFASEGSAAFKFRVYLADKNGTQFHVDNPQKFLSEKAIERRRIQNIPIHESDLPVSSQYISQLEALGCVVVAKSKWFNTVTVHSVDSTIVEDIKELSFVKDAILVWKRGEAKVRKQDSRILRSKSEHSEYYGSASNQIVIHNGDSLHRAGFRGNGMEIAVIDGGFKGLDDNALLENILVKGRKSFIYSEDDAYEIDHGLRVLSCMATNLPSFYVGTAPEAQYWLLQSENPASEFPVEEDYWVAAAEFADSVGVNVINSSLGYSVFDDSSMNYQYSQFDGKTAFITKAATMAADKGILVVSSAGNEGAKEWRYITAPADSEGALIIGAVGKDSLIASFSSRGPTADLRIKPDVMAVGYRASTLTWDGYIGDASGTSYSSPIMCGLVTCLWQAYPSLTNKQLMQVVLESSDRYLNPDNNYGYGIPDMVKAMKIAEMQTKIEPSVIKMNSNVKVTSDKSGNIHIVKNTDDTSSYKIHIFSIDGKTIISDSFSEYEKTYHIGQNKNSLYIVNICSRNFSMAEKVCF